MTDDDQPSRTRRLADFTAGLTRPDISDEVAHAAKRALLDWMSAVLAGCQDAAAGKVRTVVRSLTTGGPATAIGSDLTTIAPLAALANGYASHLQDFDDVFNPVQTTIHLGSCVWPVVMSLAETRPISGAEAIVSYLAGFETGARVGVAAGITHFESSWQVSGTAGHLASAAAAARALSLAGAATTDALGIAAAQASGIREIYGTDTKALQPGKSAMDGVLAGLLAETGLTSSPTALDGPRGLLSVISKAPQPDELVDGLGLRWHVLYNGHKLYPSASLNHAAIDAAIELRKVRGVDPADVDSIEVRMLPFAAGVTDNRHPTPGAAAKFSTQHCVATALLTGAVALPDFTADAVNRDDVTALRERTVVVGDPSIGKRGVAVALRLRDGTLVEQTIDNNRGTPENPLTDAELENKLYEVGAARYPRAALATVINYCWDLDYVDDLADVLHPLRTALEGVA